MSVQELTSKVKAEIRPATGEDEKAIFAIRSKIEPLLADRGTESDEMLRQDQFAACMVCTEWIDGINFPIRNGSESAEVLAATYKVWLKLPRRLWDAWRYAPDSSDELFNAEDLLPKEYLTVAQRTDPLPVTAAIDSETN